MSSGDEAERAQRAAGFERRAAAHEQILFGFEIRRRRFLQIFFQPFEPPLDRSEIREDQFVFDEARIARRIDRRVRMRHRGIAKRAHDVQQRVRVAIRHDVDERLRVAAARGHVRELHRGRHALLRLKHRRQLIEPVVGHARHADVGLGFAVRARGFVDAGEQFEEGGLAGTGETNQAGAQHEELRMLPRGSFADTFSGEN